MKKKILTITILILMSSRYASAQFSVGADGFFLNAGTAVVIDSLSITPAADLQIANNALEVRYTAIPGTPNASILRVYEWNTPISVNGNVGIYYDNSELNGNSATTLELQYSSISGNSNFSPLSGSNPSANYVSATVDTPGINVKQLTAASIGEVLPISLLSFDVRKEGNDAAILEWVTAQEENNSHFLIERSADGRNYEILGRVESQSETNHNTPLYHYNFIDHQPLAGNNYYRLKQLDHSGVFSYSPVRRVWFGADKGIKVYPNPTQAVVFIAGLEGNYNIHLYNAMGSLVLSAQSAGDKTQISLEHLASGTYTLYIDGAEERQVYKIVKQ